MHPKRSRHGASWSRQSLRFKVLTWLKAGQEFPPPRENLYDRFMSGPVNPVFYRFFVKADAFRATDACIGCGKCVELCP